ncbi:MULTISPECIES: hypothetical protein [unclassified Nocardioides]|uniref:hypothetical protein n=1 Tax=unclassified Nocardioides TaxID=2615069 RepID=UPI0007026F4C|nr:MULTISPECIES: hypothetical protein [unclassified Nocardioides]KRC53126.1 hypothetical protein ASE19_12155 [Nocardioides sp. Root79]KRC72654.1 hypothetical protein ASE20_08680 [Nocardioides sp. Root240]
MSRAAVRSPTRAPLEQRIGELGASRAPFSAWVVLIGLGTAALVAAMVEVGPDWLGVTGSIVIATAYTSALAARTGGRPFVFGALALLCGLVAVLSDQDILLTGAAVSTSALAAVLGVMITVPASGFLASARECSVALLCAAVGAMATVGFEPAIQKERFEYVGLGLALLGALVLVYRLGAGLHGLGRRGLVVVAIGGVVLAATLLYAEMLRQYGSSGLVDELLTWVRWSRDHLGAFPRPIETVLGVPALAYGVHMRARRRQGWWVCAFGVAATSPTATALANPAVSVTEATLSVVYGLVVGLLVGWVLIRLDLALTGNRGRRSRVAEQAAAVRPEPGRFSPLL